jgi:surface antigen
MKSSLATYTLSAGLFAIAGAIVFFTIELSHIRQDLPAILIQVEKTSGKVDPILDEIKEVRKLIPPILSEVDATRSQIPPILSEIEAVRQNVPIILDEVKETRKLVPPILAETAKTIESIPDILETLNAISSTVIQTNKEIAKTRLLVPEVLKEVKAVRKEIGATRQSIPTTLDRVDNLLAKATTTGRKATEGAVTGIFTGVITAPFRALVSLGETANGSSLGDEVFLEGEDLQIATDAAVALTKSKKGASKTWKNTKSGKNGKFTLIAKYQEDNLECLTMEHKVWSGEKKIIERVFDACRDSADSPWELKK